MRKEIAEKWIEALESGEYEQTTGCLRTQDGFCCLGVLCNLHAQDHPEIAKTQTNPERYLGEEDVLPEVVKKWAGMRSYNGLLSTHSNHCLSEMNDSGKSFEDIAEVIKQNMDNL